LQSQLSEKDVMVSKVQPELIRQWSVNKLLGANSAALRNDGVATNSSEVMHINTTVFWFVKPHGHIVLCVLVFGG